MILGRCFPWRREASERAEGGALWFPTAYQGDGRHDNPEMYGCLYTSASELAAVVEQLHVFAPYRRLALWMLRQGGVPLALASIELPDGLQLLDLDDPRVLVAEDLRPSNVATGDRTRTQADAERLHREHETAAGLRWWSTFEASWPNVTIFDRASRELAVADVRELTVFDPAVREAADFLGLG